MADSLPRPGHLRPIVAELSRRGFHTMLTSPGDTVVKNKRAVLKSAEQSA